MEELDTNLQNYKLQLQQVEAALTTNPDNEELLKLKSDLEEVITLTRDLIKAQSIEDKTKDGEIEESDITDLSTPEVSDHPTKKDWSPGDVCLALLVSDGQYYEAEIESVEGDEVSVIFVHNRSSEVTTLEFIRELPRAEGSSKFKQPQSKVREYQKKKKQKKLQRYKQLEEEREGEKSKWLAFSSKVTKKGVVKKSIFASPDNVHGRVGIGTCGVSGKGMTEFPTAEKWRKGV